MQKQGRNLQDQTKEEEIGKPLEKEFRVMIVKMLQNPQKQNGENGRINQQHTYQGTKRNEE